MNPQTGKAHGRAARRNGSKAHGRAAHDNGDDGDGTVIIDGLRLPALDDQRSGLKCAVSTCRSCYSRVWSSGNDKRQDPRRICERCVRRWPDITAHYPTEQPVFEQSQKPARLQAVLRQVHEQLIQHVRQRQQQAQRRWHAASVIQAAKRARAARDQARVRHAQKRFQRVWAAACIRRAWRLIKARRACLHARRALHAARRLQRFWRGVRARLACMQRALPVLQAALRRCLSAPRLRIGARVRLAAGAAAHGSCQVAYAQRGANTLTHDTYGTVIGLGYQRPAIVKPDDPACAHVELRYDRSDLEPIVDGEPMMACAFERTRHVRRHAAAAQLQAAQRGWAVRRRRAAAAKLAAVVTHPADRAPAFVFGGI